MGAGWGSRGVVSAPYKEWQCKLLMHDCSRCEGGEREGWVERGEPGDRREREKGRGGIKEEGKGEEERGR